MDEEIYNEIIMDHYLLSPHKKDMKDFTYCSLGVNPSCGDEITLKVKMNGDRIEDVNFTGKGCAISLSSTSIMIDLIKGKNINEALGLLEKFTNMINEKDYSDIERLGDALAFKNIANMPARMKCANLAYNTLKKILKG